MLLTRYNHRDFEPVAFGSLVDKFFNDNFFAGETSSNFTPKVDVIESKEEFEIQFLVPGIHKDDITIKLEKGQLTVSGERKLEEEKEDKNYRSVESNYGSFSRSFHLPDNIDEEKIEATHVNGILTLKIAKSDPEKTIKQISIK